MTSLERMVITNYAATKRILDLLEDALYDVQGDGSSYDNGTTVVRSKLRKLKRRLEEIEDLTDNQFYRAHVESFVLAANHRAHSN